MCKLSDVQGTVRRESMDTFYQIAVIGLIISNVVLWMLFIGLIGATKLTLQKLKEALEECRG